MHHCYSSFYVIVGNKQSNKKMADFTITCTGLTELISRLQQMSTEIPAFITEEVHQIGEEMVQEMKSNAPVRTGFLRDNIDITASNEIAVQVASLAYYSVFLEFGTIYMEPRPFFFGIAFDTRWEQKFINDFRAILVF